MIFVLENGDAGTIEQSINCITRGGTIPVIGFLRQPKKMPNVAGLALAKGAIVRGINVGAKQMTEDMLWLVCAKELPKPVQRTFGFDERSIQAAYKHLESATLIGKIAIEVCR